MIVLNVQVVCIQLPVNCPKNPYANHPVQTAWCYIQKRLIEASPLSVYKSYINTAASSPLFSLTPHLLIAVFHSLSHFNLHYNFQTPYGLTGGVVSQHLTIPHIFHCCLPHTPSWPRIANVFLCVCGHIHSISWAFHPCSKTKYIRQWLNSWTFDLSEALLVFTEV